MGLCPDCRSEGETVTYVGGSKDDVLDRGEDEEQAETDTDASSDDEPESESEDLPECDLCVTEYEPDGE